MGGGDFIQLSQTHAFSGVVYILKHKMFLKKHINHSISDGSFNKIKEGKTLKISITVALILVSYIEKQR